MPFIVRTPDHYEDTFLLIISHVEHSDIYMLQDLRNWDWIIDRRDSHDSAYIDALAQIEKDIKKRRRRTQIIAGEPFGYCERPTLEQIWETEAKKKQRESLWSVATEEEEGDVYEEGMGIPSAEVPDEQHSFETMEPTQQDAGIVSADQTKSRKYGMAPSNRPHPTSG